jgi:Tfp pilus assembly protein PilX
LIAALIVMTLLSVFGLGLVLTTSLEPAAAANYESAWVALYAAESGIAVAAHELAAMSDWNQALRGEVVSGLMDQVDGALPLPDGTAPSVVALTHTANCGHAEPCTEQELTAVTEDRPWGANNPRWQVFGVVRLGRLVGDPGGVSPAVAVVWVADDPADVDGDALRDSEHTDEGARRPGACIVAIRAEAFAARSGHRVLTATLARPFPGCGPGARVVSWHESA